MGNFKEWLVFNTKSKEKNLNNMVLLIEQICLVSHSNLVKIWINL
jgi:hypothetical protein